ncbi:uncharacterized protein LOC141530460 [Cotesia typhae]|uniref:uncharacterized protein LOC141530460 n=1 Tax=Cotesia typhae TaxID=2053667 RepID=UPI003D696390
MASSGNSADSLLTKLGLQPVTRCSLAKFYVPALGVAGYSGLGYSVLNPDLVLRFSQNVDITNMFLGTSLVGMGSYIYTREHMKPARPVVRVMYSVTGALLFNFGSVLIWAVVKSVFGMNKVTQCTLAGTATGTALIIGGHVYLNFVDSQVAKK